MFEQSLVNFWHGQSVVLTFYIAGVDVEWPLMKVIITFTFFVTITYGKVNLWLWKSLEDSGKFFFLRYCYILWMLYGELCNWVVICCNFFHIFLIFFRIWPALFVSNWTSMLERIFIAHIFCWWQLTVQIIRKKILVFSSVSFILLIDLEEKHLWSRCFCLLVVYSRLLHPLIKRPVYQDNLGKQVPER